MCLTLEWTKMVSRSRSPCLNFLLLDITKFDGSGDPEAPQQQYVVAMNTTTLIKKQHIFFFVFILERVAMW